MCVGLNVNYSLLSSSFNKICYFSYRISKSPRITNVKKIRPVEAELFLAD